MPVEALPDLETQIGDGIAVLDAAASERAIQLSRLDGPEFASSTAAV